MSTEVATPSKDARELELTIGGVVRDAIVRTLAVLGLAGVALIHLLDAHDTFVAAPYKGWLYIGLIVGSVATAGVLALYRVRPPLRLATILAGVQPDGWTGATAAYTRYAVAKGATQVVVTVFRPRLKGPPPAHIEVAVGAVAVVNGAATITRPWARQRWTLRNGTEHRFVLPLRKGPFQVQLAVTPTFVPTQYGLADTRTLGVQVSSFSVR